MGDCGVRSILLALPSGQRPSFCLFLMVGGNSFAFAYLRALSQNRPTEEYLRSRGIGTTGSRSPGGRRKLFFPHHVQFHQARRPLHIGDACGDDDYIAFVGQPFGQHLFLHLFKLRVHAPELLYPARMDAPVESHAAYNVLRGTEGDYIHLGAQHGDEPRGRP